MRYDDVWVWWLWRGQDTSATPLWIASQEGHDLVVRTLLASGANVNQSTTVSGIRGRCVMRGCGVGFVACVVCEVDVAWECCFCILIMWVS